ncbi:germin-like protein 1-3 [Aegilops tauschii subsp. strangulata]|uniref:Germin-like protein n=1 Tax=Aegilops tauschii subsp. strangulata TaxID=200361 RepID=A0A453GN37_AEGTS|nr:germin-like protein 1-3 [Aegilops tauschii subsp. strangulata]
MASKQLPAVLLAAYAAVLALAGDPDMLQDLCVADYKSLDGPLRLNGYPCKRPESTTANDFFSDVLSVPGNTGGNPSGSVVTAATVDKVPGLNTMGVSMSRIDYAPWGANPPHTHPGASELLLVLEGSLDVGFITTTGKFVGRTVCKGEMFVFPRGLVHFQRNNNGSPAAAISAFNSQLPGTQKWAEALYTALPPVPADVLARALDVNDCMVEPCVI